MTKNLIPKTTGLRFKENDELKDLISNTEELTINYNLEYYFNSNRNMNSKEYLKEEVGINQHIKSNNY